MEKRFIACTYRNCNYILNQYESRKQSEEIGRKYSRKGLFNLISSLNFEFMLDDNSSEDIKAEAERKHGNKSVSYPEKSATGF